MRRRHGVHVIDFAVRSHAVVIGRTVPACPSNFGGERNQARRNVRFGEIGGVNCGGGMFAVASFVVGWWKRRNFPQRGAEERSHALAWDGRMRRRTAAL